MSFAAEAGQPQIPYVENTGARHLRMLARLLPPRTLSERVQDWCAQNWIDPLRPARYTPNGPVIAVCKDRSPARLVPPIGGGAVMSFSCASRGTRCPAGPVTGLRREPITPAG